MFDRWFHYIVDCAQPSILSHFCAWLKSRENWTPAQNGRSDWEKQACFRCSKRLVDAILRCIIASRLVKRLRVYSQQIHFPIIRETSCQDSSSGQQRPAKERTHILQKSTKGTFDFGFFPLCAGFSVD